MLEAAAQTPLPIIQRPSARGSSTAQLTYGTHIPYVTDNRRPRGWSPSILLMGSVAVGFSLLVVFAMLHFREVLAHLGPWSYLGVFLAEMGNSAVIVIPTPGPAYTFAMGVTLNPFILGLIGGVGAALGELIGYFLGAKGRRIFEGGRLYDRFRTMTTRWTGGALFAFALLPVPFDVAGLWAGTVRYPVWRFMLYVIPGKVVKVTGVALAGYYGLGLVAGTLG